MTASGCGSTMPAAPARRASTGRRRDHLAGHGRCQSRTVRRLSRLAAARRLPHRRIPLDHAPVARHGPAAHPRPRERGGAQARTERLRVGAEDLRPGAGLELDAGGSAACWRSGSRGASSTPPGASSPLSLPDSGSACCRAEGGSEQVRASARFPPTDIEKSMDELFQRFPKGFGSGADTLPIWEQWGHATTMIGKSRRRLATAARGMPCRRAEMDSCAPGRA